MPYNATSQTLSGAWPRMAAAARTRAEEALASGCNCGSGTATFKKRQIGGAVTIWLQCDGCGRAYANSFKRTDHYNWQDYPVWDDTLRDDYSERCHQERLERQSADLSTPEARLAAYRARAAEYHEWCRTSPEWHDLVKKVLWRSRGFCEACLNSRADTVHHLTYDYGKLPPAWHLRAVCRGCHNRLHAGEDDWCDDGMARGS